MKREVSRQAALVTKIAAVFAGGAGWTFVVSVASLPLMLSTEGRFDEGKKRVSRFVFPPLPFFIV